MCCFLLEGWLLHPVSRPGGDRDKLEMSYDGFKVLLDRASKNRSSFVGSCSMYYLSD